MRAARGIPTRKRERERERESKEAELQRFTPPARSKEGIKRSKGEREREEGRDASFLPPYGAPVPPPFSLIPPRRLPGKERITRSLSSFLIDYERLVLFLSLSNKESSSSPARPEERDEYYFERERSENARPTDRWFLRREREREAVEWTRGGLCPLLCCRRSLSSGGIFFCAMLSLSLSLTHCSAL